MAEKKKEGSFWTTVPGIMTGCAAILTAVGGFIATLVAVGIIITEKTPTPIPTKGMAVVTQSSPASTLPPKPPTIVPATIPPKPPPTVVVITQPSPTFTPTPEPDEFFIVNQLSGKCIDAKGRPGTANETPLQLWDCEYNDPSTDQKWRLVNNGFLQNTLSGRCLEVRGRPGMNDEDLLQLWDCEFSDPNNTDQRWRLTANGFLQNMLSDKCIDVKGLPGISNEDSLQLWSCEMSDSSTDQKWDFVR